MTIKSATRRNSAFGRHEVLCGAAVLAAHAFFYRRGSRQRDVRFFLQLFSNWLEHAVGEEAFEVRNMQISRYLTSLCDEGYARESKRKGKAPEYVLTRVGIVEVLRTLVEYPLYQRPNLLLFVRYFLMNYRETIIEVVTNAGTEFPPALRLELDPLLDSKRLMRKQIELAEREYKKLKLRLDDSAQMGRLATMRFREDLPLAEIVAEIEEKYPYELNSQKPLRELFASLPPDHARWELTEGAQKRAHELWTPMEKFWRHYLKTIQDLC